MINNLAQKAISLSLCSSWKEAIKTNLDILEENPEDVDSLNRLARAYYEIGEINNAKKTSQKVLAIDPLNVIANKSIEKYKSGKKIDSGTQVENGNIDVSIFIEEYGKTKVTTLLNVGSEKTVDKLLPGCEIRLLTHTHRVTANTFDGKYLGKLPDDLSARIRYLVKQGNSFKAYIKSIQNSGVKIIIKEDKKAKGMESVISFPREASESAGE